MATAERLDLRTYTLDVARRALAASSNWRWFRARPSSNGCDARPNYCEHGARALAAANALDWRRAPSFGLSPGPGRPFEAFAKDDRIDGRRA